MVKIPGVIVALDVEERKKAIKLVDRLKGQIDFFKVGSRLFTAEGPGMVQEITASGARVFLDLKFHDIPATVAGSVRAACGLGISMMTIHTCGGSDMMKAAADEAGEYAERSGGARPLIVGVTVLTSMSKEDLADVSCYDGGVEDLVLRRADRAVSSGLDGVVASVRETAAIRKEFGEDIVIVTPGIRPAGASVGDQKRVATPRVAMESGSTYLVVGRPIYQAESPAEAAAAIIGEMKGSGPTE
ncbi:MAG: orotidine-5'-phosphate decarboxylase [Candidatus Krumholzibacteria bacterium]|nr:orotidine-5'-phosphate decarboxylase [Candidatus Krumholzibacteria bacterium]